MSVGDREHFTSRCRWISQPSRRVAARDRRKRVRQAGKQCGGSRDLYGFFDWAVNECPAEHYLLIFWGHSRGQFGMFGDWRVPSTTRAQTLTLDELGTR